jgi:DNA-directed RNA polymerase subunit beta'
LIPKLNAKEIFNLALMDEENLNINNFLSKKLNDEKLKISLFVKKFEYIELNTILGRISIIPTKNLKIETVNKITDDYTPKILLTSKENYKIYYNEYNLGFIKNGYMIRKDDKIEPRSKINYSGKIIALDPFKFKIHKGTPFYVTPETKLYKKINNFIKQGEVFGVIRFEQIVTGDIVQGLPKIEEILEARKPQNPAILANNAGVVKQTYPHKIELIGNTNQDKNFKSLENGKKKSLIVYSLIQLKNKNAIIVKKNDYIYLGQALTEGSINPHNLLTVYFNYYKNFGNDYDAAYMSFKNLQLLLIQKVQQVYNSQGVSIADKHLEVIVKRISSKVQILNSGASFLLPGEIIELKQVNYINNILMQTCENLASYNPILLGITKASLLTDSFISAASFQETTKILTAAAIEGKIDWLRGLKENVIIGRLIPAGTGFRDDLLKN